MGTGLGLLALGARPRAGQGGLVVGLDLSEDNLRESRRAAGNRNGDQAKHALVGADAVRLPFRDASFDAVMTRSVLTYVEDRYRAIQELHRILKPGGRASIFEPINRVYMAPNVRSKEPALSSIRAAHNRVIAYLDVRSQYAKRMCSFDERDLLREFEHAGFNAITLAYEHHYERGHRPARWDALSFVSTRPNPGTVSYEEAAREVLGEEADAHLERFTKILTTAPYRLVWAVAYIVATK